MHNSAVCAELQRIIEAWPELPEQVKKTIKKLVEKNMAGHKQLRPKTAYRQFKTKYADCVLLFSMGDIYEAYYEDARLCSKILGVTLDSRFKDDECIPLVRIPRFAVNGYVKKLIQADYKVALCEQIEGQDVVKILTPKMLSELSGQDS